MTRFLIALLIMLLFSCSSVHQIGDNSKLDIEDSIIQYTLKKADAVDDYKAIIFFTVGFENDLVELINGDNIIFHDSISTLDQLGLARTVVINNKKRVSIKMESSNKLEFILNRNKLLNYKFIYISKNIDEKQKIKVVYSNKKKQFL